VALITNSHAGVGNHKLAQVPRHVEFVRPPPLSCVMPRPSTRYFFRSSVVRPFSLTAPVQPAPLTAVVARLDWIAWTIRLTAEDLVEILALPLVRFTAARGVQLSQQARGKLHRV